MPKKNEEIPRCDIIIMKMGKCGFCPNDGVELYGFKIVIPVPDCKECGHPEVFTFICECCLRTYMGKIQDTTYMEDWFTRKKAKET